MLIKKVSFTLLLAGAIAVFTPVTHAQSADTAVRAASQESQPGSNARNHYAIVGSWMGTVGDGSRAINSFTSDGIMFGSVQGEVSVPHGVLTPIHGEWAHLGGRQFGVTTVGLFYDIQTGDYQGFVEIHLLLRINPAGDHLRGTDQVSIFGPDGNLVDAFPAGQVQFTRIKAE